MLQEKQQTTNFVLFNLLFSFFDIECLSQIYMPFGLFHTTISDNCSDNLFDYFNIILGSPN